MLQKPLPRIDEVFASLLQEERQQNGTDLEEERALAFDSKKGKDEGVSNAGKDKGNGNKGRGGSNKGNKSSKQCTHYGKLGHLVDTCYKNHGYSPHYKNNGALVNMVAAEKGDNNNHSQKEMDNASNFYLTPD
ncbi:hypothetical protein PIB30_084491 [Stylosanthes scabra]|uniref:Uncharacterized protein n=1 Tax=Stylosanthes scabra TaxID=79078 RepID=A0ABU6XRY3_9FABA|nr:hypothetical protein [Stylosanthes scabra]